VSTCIEAFDAVLGDRPNQLERQRDDVTVSPAALTDVSTTEGEITLDGVRTNVAVSLAYLTAWIGGAGAVAIFSLMEDAATVEISRMQIWQWVHHGATAADGTPITAELVRGLVAEEAERLTEGADEELRTRVVAARDVFETVALADDWPQFFTSYAYDTYLVETS
jgi:malate synthase